MAGARLGYLVGPSWLVEELDKVVLPYHLAAATQAAGTVALAYREEMAARVRELVAERERLHSLIRQLQSRETQQQAQAKLLPAAI